MKTAEKRTGVTLYEDRLEMKNIKIIVATHKKYKMPNDPMYLPLHVGAEGKTTPDGSPLNLGYQKDNTGDNISTRNPSFCELTGLYWAWKNLDVDYIGLVHYRRHFGIRRKDPMAGVLSSAQLVPLLGKYKVFVPKKRHYYIETLYSHYAHTHYASQLDCTRKIIAEKYPTYLPSFDNVVHKTCGYMFNMMIMERTELNRYCTWLFDILFELERQIQPTELSAFQGRFYGRISEIIFNVWLDEQLESGAISSAEIKELPYFHVEKVNWAQKGTAFLKAKLFHKKYEGSF